MNKFIKMSAVGLIAAMPFMALAHNDGKGFDKNVSIQSNNSVRASLDNMFRAFNHDGNKNKDDKNNQRFTGTVTAVSSTGFTLNADNATSYTVNTGSSQLMSAFGGSILLGNISVNDKANVKGSVSGSVITADKVVVTPPNTHKAV